MDHLRKVIQEFDEFDQSLDVQARKSETLDKIAVLESLAPDIQKEFSGHPLPLELYTFTLKSLLCPHFKTNLTPHILDVLAMIEFYRRFVVMKMLEILVFHDYHGTFESQTNQMLGDEDKSFFTQFKDEDTSMRLLFLKIVALCCRVDVCQKWLQNSLPDFWVRWNQYFSFLEEDPQNIETPALKFQHDLVPEEREIFRNAAETCSKYATLTFNVAESQKREDQTIHELMQTSDFAQQHQLQNLDDFSNKIILYADRVSDAWNRFRNVNNNNNFYDVSLDK